MRVVIDTSSLMALVRYYIPLDEKNFIREFVKEKVQSGEIVIIDGVFDESRRIAKGIIIESFDFLNDKSLVIKTENIIPSASFMRDLENRFCYGFKRKEFSVTEFEVAKSEYLKTADARLVLYCLSNNDELGIDKKILVTEETIVDNDRKLFKKLPEICNITEVPNCNLTTLFKEHYKLSLIFK